MELQDVWIGELQHKQKRLARLRARAPQHLLHYVEPCLEVNKKITRDHFCQKVLNDTVRQSLLAGGSTEHRVQLCHIHGFKEDRATWMAFCKVLNTTGVVGMSIIGENSYMFFIPVTTVNDVLHTNMMSGLRLGGEQCTDTLYGLLYWDCPLHSTLSLTKSPSMARSQPAAPVTTLTGRSPQSKTTSDNNNNNNNMSNMNPHSHNKEDQVTRNKAQLKASIDQYFNKQKTGKTGNVAMLVARKRLHEDVPDEGPVHKQLRTEYTRAQGSGGETTVHTPQTSLGIENSDQIQDPGTPKKGKSNAEQIQDVLKQKAIACAVSAIRTTLATTTGGKENIDALLDTVLKLAGSGQWGTDTDVATLRFMQTLSKEKTSSITESQSSETKDQEKPAEQDSAVIVAQCDTTQDSPRPKSKPELMASQQQDHGYKTASMGSQSSTENHQTNLQGGGFLVPPQSLNKGCFSAQGVIPATGTIPGLDVGSASTEKGQEVQKDHMYDHATYHADAATEHPYTAAQSEYAAIEHEYASTEHGYTATEHEYAAMEHVNAATEHGYTATEYKYAATEHANAATEHTNAATEHTNAATEHTNAATESTSMSVDDEDQFLYGNPVKTWPEFDVSTLKSILQNTSQLEKSGRLHQSTEQVGADLNVSTLKNILHNTEQLHNSTEGYRKVQLLKGLSSESSNRPPKKPIKAECCEHLKNKRPSPISPEAGRTAAQVKVEPPCIPPADNTRVVITDEDILKANLQAISSESESENKVLLQTSEQVLPLYSTSFQKIPRQRPQVQAQALDRLKQILEKNVDKERAGRDREAQILLDSQHDVDMRTESEITEPSSVWDRRPARMSGNTTRTSRSVERPPPAMVDWPSRSHDRYTAETDRSSRSRSRSYSRQYTTETDRSRSRSRSHDRRDRSKRDISSRSRSSSHVRTYTSETDKSSRSRSRSRSTSHGKRPTHTRSRTRSYRTRYRADTDWSFGSKSSGRSQEKKGKAKGMDAEFVTDMWNKLRELAEDKQPLWKLDARACSYTNEIYLFDSMQKKRLTPIVPFSKRAEDLRSQKTLMLAFKYMSGVSMKLQNDGFWSISAMLEQTNMTRKILKHMENSKTADQGVVSLATRKCLDLINELNATKKKKVPTATLR